MRDLKIRLMQNKKDLEHILKIREIVFIKGQKVPKHRERDNLDSSAKQVLVLYKNNPVGCARIRFIGRKAKLESIALLKRYRGRGFGIFMMGYLINYCRKKKIKEIVLHSQCYIQDFYNNCGFKPRGKVFMDAGIRHIEMYLQPKY
jgi:predicted GNAT family N-acyltransferase